MWGGVQQQALGGGFSMEMMGDLWQMTKKFYQIPFFEIFLRFRLYNSRPVLDLKVQPT